jgi:hypothetical protein
MSGVLLGIVFAVFGTLALVVNMRRPKTPIESWFAFAAIRIAPPVVLCVFGLAVALIGLRASVSPDHDRVTACLYQYHSATSDPMPANSIYPSLPTVTYAVPCNALSAQGEGRWEVLVVGPDDKTIRIYFIGGTVGDRSGLLRTVIVNETASTVTIQIEVGGDPSNLGGGSSAVGQMYVTQIVLSRRLAGRALTGPNNSGVVEHL